MWLPASPYSLWSRPFSKGTASNATFPIKECIMSQTIRAVGVGLLGAGWLALRFQLPFMQWVGSGESKGYVFGLAIRSISGASAGSMGYGLYAPAIFLFGCLGIGLLAAGAIYPTMEDGISAILRYAAHAVSTVTKNVLNYELDCQKSGVSNFSDMF
jgi:hypothetical protein